MKMKKVVIEESNEATESLGMLLSPFGNLSHTSILYYYAYFTTVYYMNMATGAWIASSK